MKFIVKFSSRLSFLAILFPGILLADEPVEIVIGHNHVPPIVMKDGTGIALDYIKMIMDKSGEKSVKFEHKYMPWSRLHMSFDKNEIPITAMGGSWVKEFGDRNTEKPYALFKFGIIVAEDSKYTKFDVPADFKGVQICSKQGMSLSPKVQAAEKAGTLKMVWLAGDLPLERGIKKLQQNWGCDAVYSACTYELEYMATQLKFKYRVIDLKDGHIPIHFAFNKSAMHIKKIVDDFQRNNDVNKIISSMVDDYVNGQNKGE